MWLCYVRTRVYTHTHTHTHKIVSSCQSLNFKCISSILYLYSPLLMIGRFFFCFFLNFIYLFIYLLTYLWLCWVFISVWGLSLVAASGDHSSSRCTGLSLSWPLLLQSTGSRCTGSAIVAHGPSHSVGCGIFPDHGSNPCPLHWQADSQPLHHQGSPMIASFHVIFVCGLFPIYTVYLLLLLSFLIRDFLVSSCGFFFSS